MQNTFVLDITTPQRFVNEFSNEMCGFLYNDDADINKLNIFLENFGREIEILNEGKRGFCNFSADHSISWHTHPSHLPGHFSAEDIIRCLRAVAMPIESYLHGAKTELIFTSMGMWEINVRKTFNFDNTWEQFLLNNIKYFVNKFTNREISLQELIQKTLDETNNPYLGINNCFINLTPWHEINDNKYSLYFQRNLTQDFIGIAKKNRYEFTEIFYTNIPAIKNNFPNARHDQIVNF
jgi:hypothetical protein